MYTLSWKARFLLVKVSNLDHANVWNLELLEQMIQWIVFVVAPPPHPPQTTFTSSPSDIIK